MKRISIESIFPRTRREIIKISFYDSSAGTEIEILLFAGMVLDAENVDLLARLRGHYEMPTL